MVDRTDDLLNAIPLSTFYLRDDKQRKSWSSKSLALRRLLLSALVCPSLNRLGSTRRSTESRDTSIALSHVVYLAAWSYFDGSYIDTPRKQKGLPQPEK